jgi:hypothetical protein
MQTPLAKPATNPDASSILAGSTGVIMHRFLRCQTHPKCPNVIGWYLVLEPSDVETLAKLHKGVAGLYYYKFGLDPHITESEMAPYYNPVKLAAQWYASVEIQLQKGALLVNSCGGCLPMDDSVKILSEHESEVMEWPDYYDDEVITISRWPEGKHYYLSSNKNRVFVPSKWHSYKLAHRVASKYTNNIRSKGC